MWLTFLLLASCSQLEPDLPVFSDVDGDGYTTDEGDCSDLDADSYPGATELCDGADNDCDGEVDEGLATDWYADSDDDGYGAPDYVRQACSKPDGYVGNGDDCDDDNTRISPGSDERCDGVDNDCDGEIDETDASDADAWYPDQDGDGYGAAEGGVSSCDDVTGYVNIDQDCDDTDATIYPGAPEITPGVDNDCDGVVGNTWPTAVPVCMSEQPAATCDTVALDGTGSLDLDGDTISAWAWSLEGAPASSTLTSDDIEEQTDAQPVFVPDAPGTFTFGLVVNDGEDDSVLETVDVEVVNRSYNADPVADAGADQAVDSTTECSETAYGYACSDCTEATLVLDGSGSYDANDDPLSWQWSSTSLYASFTNDDEAVATLTISGIEGDMGTVLTETITVVLEVTDCMQGSGSDTVDIVVTCTDVSSGDDTGTTSEAAPSARARDLFHLGRETRPSP